jgi:O6-methylguanine-DNA--protein-cysteine methyltransferase
MSPRYQRILRIVAKIPRGRVMTYGGVRFATNGAVDLAAFGWTPRAKAASRATRGDASTWSPRRS